MRISPALPFAILLVGLTACTSAEGGPRSTAGATPPAKPGASAPSAPGAGNGSSFTISAALDTDAAAQARAGTQYTHRYTPATTVASGLTANVLDITGDGRLVVAGSPDAKSVDGVVQIEQSRVGIQDATTFKPFPPAHNGKCQNTRRQAIYADEQQDTVVWTESASTNLFAVDWCVFAYNPQSKTSALLGDSATIGPKEGMPEPPGTSAVTVGTSQAFWATAYPTPGKKPEFGVKIVTRGVNGGGQLETAVDRAKLPQAVGDTLFYVRSADIAPGFDAHRFEIRKRSAQGDGVVASGRLAEGQTVSALSATATRTTWVIANSDGETSTLYSLDLAANKAVSVKLHHPGPSTMHLRSTDTHLIWGSGSAAGDAGQYLYALDTGKLWRLGSEEGYSVVHAKGDHIAWAAIPDTAPDAKATYEVADLK
ncbi:hypothetical protein ACWCQL_21990 [Streptomyces sp. NPDC002073]